MAYAIIDVDKDKPNFTQVATLDGVDYTFTFVWNMRSGWYLGLSVSTSTGMQVIFYPRRITVGFDLLEAHRFDPNCPPGYLIAMDTSGANADPGFDDLRGGPKRQGRVLLAYGSAL